MQDLVSCEVCRGRELLRTKPGFIFASGTQRHLLRSRELSARASFPVGSDFGAVLFTA